MPPTQANPPTTPKHSVSPLNVIRVVYRGLGGFLGGETFARKFSPLRKVAKFATQRIFRRDRPQPTKNTSMLEASAFLEVAKFSPSEIIPGGGGVEKIRAIFFSYPSPLSGGTPRKKSWHPM